MVSEFSLKFRALCVRQTNTGVHNEACTHLKRFLNKLILELAGLHQILEIILSYLIIYN